MAAVLALGSAVTFGVADFLGGLAARRERAVVVTLMANVAGAVVVLLAAPLVGGELTGRALGIGAMTGVAGVIGLVAYFHALGSGPMGVSAPLAALVGAIVPVSFGLLAAERPGGAAVAGMALGILAVVLVSLPAGESVELTRVTRRAAGWAALGGFSFGLFFVGLDAAPSDSGLWPLLGARLASVPLMAALLLHSARRSGTPALSGASAWPWRLAVPSGALDMVANTLFLYAARTGLLTITSVLASLYPAVVALLAGLVLRERLSGAQRIGVPVALAAVVLLAV